MRVNRRDCVKKLTVAVVTSVLSRTTTAERTDFPQPIQLHVELDVIPGKEKELEKGFREDFTPVISKQPGFVEVKLLRFTKAFVGKERAPYRLLISFEREEQRLQWVANPEHQRIWPSIGKTLRSQPNSVTLY